MTIIVKAVADPGEGPVAGHLPCFLDRSEARKAEQFFFGDFPPPSKAPPLFSRSGYDTGKCVCVFFRQKSNGKISSTSQTGQASKSLNRWSVRKGNSVLEADANS